MKHSIKLSGLQVTETSHGGTTKRVFLNNDNLPNALTQIAFGTFNAGESCPMHSHETMDEYFFFLKGTGTYIIGEETVDLEENLLVEVPAGIAHQLQADRGEKLEFIYWGVAK